MLWDCISAGKKVSTRFFPILGFSAAASSCRSVHISTRVLESIKKLQLSERVDIFQSRLTCRASSCGRHSQKSSKTSINSSEPRKSRHRGSDPRPKHTILFQKENWHHDKVYRLLGGIFLYSVLYCVIGPTGKPKSSPSAPSTSNTQKKPRKKRSSCPEAPKYSIVYQDEVDLSQYMPSHAAKNIVLPKRPQCMRVKIELPKLVRLSPDVVVYFWPLLFFYNCSKTSLCMIKDRRFNVLFLILLYCVLCHLLLLNRKCLQFERELLMLPICLLIVLRIIFFWLDNSSVHCVHTAQRISCDWAQQ